MGYREDGNFNINWEYDGKSKPGIYARENAPFIFPDDGIRFLQAQAALDKLSNNKSTISEGDYKIHRGYIRNLEQPAFGNVPIMRCNFQFNPQQIQQSVAMRDDVYLPILQAPEQLAQPLGANTNFSFDLFFDRSHELAKGVPSNGIGSGVSADTTERVTPNTSADLSAQGDNDAYDIGVLADLRIFYSVIGQGFSQEMLDFQKKMFEYNANSALAASAGVASAGIDSSGSTTAPTVDASNLDTIMNLNTGNFGILMPNPVRVMFSSLFMVDGFITSTNVDFLKFSSKMVPIQCRIGITMNALHIGFAQSKTFITKVFEDAANAKAAQDAEYEAYTEELTKALYKSCKTFIFAVDNEEASWDNAAAKKGSGYPVWAMAVDNSLTPGGRGLFLGFSEIVPKPGGGKDKDSILELYENGASVNISYDWTLKVWGSKRSPLNFNEATNFKFKGEEDSDYKDKIKLLGNYSGSETASSKEQWGAGTDDKARRRSLKGNDKIPNSASDRWTKSDSKQTYSNVDDSFKQGFFIVEITVTLSASMNGAPPITYTYSNGREVMPGSNGRIYKKISVNWSGPTGANEGSNLIAIV